MSRVYSHIRQPKMIEAINALPVIPQWAAAPWITDPIGLESKRRKLLTKEKKARLLKATI